jgi:hypothetical protein
VPKVPVPLGLGQPLLLDLPLSTFHLELLFPDKGGCTVSARHKKILKTRHHVSIFGVSETVMRRMHDLSLDAWPFRDPKNSSRAHARLALHSCTEEPYGCSEVLYGCTETLYSYGSRGQGVDTYFFDMPGS